MHIEHLWPALKAAARLWYEEDGDLLAATVSYYALFAITPLLLISVSLVSLLYGRELVATTFRDWGSILGGDLLSLLTAAVGNLENLSENFAVPILGVIFFSGMTIVMFNTFTTGLHQLWGIRHAGVRGWVKKSLFSAGFIFVFEAYLLLLVGLYQLLQFMEVGAAGLLANFLNFLISLALTTGLFSLMYHFLPWEHPPLRARLTGAFVASLLFTVGKFAVAFYVSETPVPDLFGAAGVLLVLLIWLYVSIAMIYYGAALAFVLAKGKLIQRTLPNGWLHT